MGNVRNPVGPLPSSIYWRRRAVVLCLLAIVLALVAWAVVSGSGGKGGSRTGARGPGHSGSPLPSITPGPAGSSPAITTEPGGRTSGGSGGGSASGSGGDTGGSSTSGSSTGGTSAGSSTGGSATGGTDPGGTDGGGTDGGAGASSGATGGGSAGAGAGARLPVGTSVSDCSGGSAKLEVRSVHSTYTPGQRPTFAITAVNSGDAACKVNFSAVGTVVTVTDSGGHHIWASDDCPPGRTPYLLRVPAGGNTIDDVDWNRTPSAPQCATPVSTGIAGSGTYHVRVAVPGLSAVTTTFTLAG